jgi:hypothetical protein
MLAIRSTTRVSAIIAAAGACLMLAGCGGGSVPGASAAAPASSSAAVGGSSSAAAPASSSPAAGSSSAPAVAGYTAPKLTGHFCTDLDNMGNNLPKVPAADKESLAALEANGGQLFKEFAGYFTSLANEAPPQAAPELRIIAAAYASMGNGNLTASSVAQLTQQMEGITTHGQTGKAFLSLITYISTHCH